MTTKEFVGYFRMAKDKKDECKKHVKKSYVPFTTKLAECLRVVKATMEYKADENAVPVYTVNTPMRYLIFHMSLIKLYADIELDDQLTDEYDILNECGAFSVLISCIPESEFKEFSTLLSMCVDDYMANNREFTAYIDKKMDGLVQMALAAQASETKEE